MYQIALQLSEPPSQTLLEAMLNALAAHDARWYLAQWRARREPPPSAVAGRVRWLPDAPATNAVFQDAAQVFARRQASCGPIAAIAVGYARALEQWRGVPASHANEMHRVVLLPQGPLRARRQWHAYHLAGARLIDPTAHMRRR